MNFIETKLTKLPSVLVRLALPPIQSTSYFPISRKDRRESVIPRDSNRSCADFSASERFEPSSRTSLNGEQPYPWDLLQPQDEMSRHRGAEHCRRFGLLDNTSLLSPE